MFKSNFSRYLYLTLSLLISSVGYNLFIRTFNIVAGGTGGLAIIAERLFGIDSAITIFVVCILLVIISFIFLGKEESIAGLYIAIVYPIFVYLTSFLVGYFHLSEDNILLAVIFGGIISGIGNGMNYQTGLNTGGFGIIAQIIQKRRHVDVAMVNFIINAIIVFIGGIVIGFDMVLYAIVMIYIMTFISQRVFIGISQNKLFYIISDKYEEITLFIKDELLHDVTLYDVKGEYLNKNRKMIMCVVPTSQYFILKNAIKEIDKEAFVFISDSYETGMQDIYLKKVIS